MNEKVAKAIAAAESQMGAPYVYGAWGAKCTPTERRNRANSDKDHMEAIYKNCQVLNGSRASCDGCKYQGMNCYDCRGFSHWVFLQVGIDIAGAGATSQYNTESNWVLRGEIKDMPDVLCAVFKYSGGKMIHTGVHVGGGRIIHCSVGVQNGKTTDSGWTHFAIPFGLYYSEELANAGKLEVMPTVKNGSKGAAVSMLQTELAKLGYNPGTIDGVFGDKTAAALRAFQADHDLMVDAVCGTKTWAEIKKLGQRAEETEQGMETVEPVEPEEKQEEVQDSNQPVTRAEFEALKREVERLWYALGIACNSEGEQENELFE